MARYETLSIDLGDSPDYGPAWQEWIEADPGFTGTGVLGMVVMKELGDDPWDAEPINVPVVVVDDWVPGVVEILRKMGVPTCINVGRDDWYDLINEDLLLPIIWHECGHAYNEGEPVEERRYNCELAADKFAAEHLGVEKVIRYLNKTANLFCEFGDEGYVELAFRAADLGAKKVLRTIEKYGWKHP